MLPNQYDSDGFPCHPLVDEQDFRNDAFWLRLQGAVNGLRKRLIFLNDLVPEEGVEPSRPVKVTGF